MHCSPPVIMAHIILLCIILPTSCIIYSHNALLSTGYHGTHYSPIFMHGYLPVFMVHFYPIIMTVMLHYSTIIVHYSSVIVQRYFQSALYNSPVMVNNNLVMMYYSRTRGTLFSSNVTLCSSVSCIFFTG
jgi:hypothetical protein